MRREFMLAIVCLVLSCGVFASAASAQGQQVSKRPYPPGISEARLIQQRAEALELSPETIEGVNKLITDAEAAGQQRLKESSEAMKKVQALLDEPLPDEKSLGAAGRAAGEIAMRMREEQLKVTVRVRALLTEEQLVKFMDIRSRVTVPRQGGGRGRR